ncbi:pentapeptide repeat-containing protein [Clostridium sp.]|uniref:pentapeptide repeat-containing protein n=1 Tax=Clostridium sp. TaxID=1506 RepID=UPI0026030373|nr:pentapeptide repeat-containing protein [Clostridium sp.]
MAYVNFKEELYVAKKQLEKRFNNNEKLFNDIKGSRKISNKYNPDEKYSYKKFNDSVFGGGHAKSEDEFKEISNIDIVCTKFINCKFSNIKFKGCKFIGCYFINSNFNSGGVIFEECIFIKQESDILPNLNKDDNLSCTFDGGKIYAKFLSCNLSYTIFTNCNFKNTNFEVSDMSDVFIINSNLNMIIIIDSDLSGIKIVNTYIEDLEFRDKDKSKLDEKSFIDKIPLKYYTRDEYEGIYTVYENIADKFKDNNLKNNFGEYYFLCKKMQRKTLDPLPKVTSFLAFITCGYGERPLYSLYFSFVIILIFSILYLIFGIKVDEEIIRYTSLNDRFTIQKFLKDYNESLNLSVGMFASVGLNEAQPAPASYMISNIEMILGVLMNGIGIGALIKKIVR